MKFEFIANASGIFKSKNGKSVLLDPWLMDGVFEGSWCHFHKLQTTSSQLQDVDAIYLSHIHPDHYDERDFNYRKDIPIFVLDHGLNFLHKNLEAKGYKNLIKIKNDETIKFEDFEITLYAPFVKNNFFEDESVVGNLIDSAMVIESDGLVAFNANDNTPDVEACKYIRKKFGSIDLAMLNYNAAGPYPSCFNNLTDEEKFFEQDKNLKRNYEYLLSNLRELKPKYMLPFAGAYTLGGKLSKKNKYLGIGTWDDCADYLRRNINFGTEVICLRETDEINIADGARNKDYIPIDKDEIYNYSRNELSNLEYDYEKDPEPCLATMQKDINIASIKMQERCGRIKLKPDMNVNIKLEDDIIEICNSEESKGNLSCSMDSRLLRRILDRKSHWNNAEIGCHIEFNRTPNYYSPDIHLMLQFFHL